MGHMNALRKMVHVYFITFKIQETAGTRYENNSAFIFHYIQDSKNGTSDTQRMGVVRL